LKFVALIITANTQSASLIAEAAYGAANLAAAVVAATSESQHLAKRSTIRSSEEEFHNHLSPHPGMHQQQHIHTLHLPPAHGLDGSFIGISPTNDLSSFSASEMIHQYPPLEAAVSRPRRNKPAKSPAARGKSHVLTPAAQAAIRFNATLPPPDPSMLMDNSALNSGVADSITDLQQQQHPALAESLLVPHLTPIPRGTAAQESQVAAVAILALKQDEHVSNPQQEPFVSQLQK